MILAPGIPMCFSLATKTRKRWQQWLWLLFIPLLILVVVVIGSRAGLIICGVLTIVCAVWFFKKLNLVSKISLGLVSLMVLGFFHHSNINYTKDPIREALIDFAVERIKERPVFGHGYSIQRVLLEERASDPEALRIHRVTAKFDHFHNTYLDEVFQFGLIGSLPLALLLLYLIYLCVKKRDVFLLSFLVIYLLFFYVETPFNSVKGIMPMMLLICLVMNMLNEQTVDKKDQLCQ
jgi:O-antigen ligase